MVYTPSSSPIAPTYLPIPLCITFTQRGFLIQQIIYPAIHNNLHSSLFDVTRSTGSCSYINWRF